MRIGFFGDSLTEGTTGVGFIPMLQQRFPEHEMLNFGKGGDTVLSLYRRLLRLDPAGKFDLAFLWIGVNDVLVKVRWHFPIIKRLQGQPWAHDSQQFSQYYHKLLHFLDARSSLIITVPPLLIGEDLSNRWNRELASQAELIEKISNEHPHAAFVNLRQGFIDGLAGTVPSPFYLRSVVRTMLDYFVIKKPVDADRLAAERQLQFTLDGIHLNSRGAGLVADILSPEISHRMAEAERI